MSRRSYPLLALLVSGCSVTTANEGHVTSTQATNRTAATCGGLLRPVSGTEIAEMIAGARVRFAGQEGVCRGSIWITSNWEWRFEAADQVWLQGDRAGQAGSYTIKGDQLCITSNSEVHCHQLYRDGQRRIYLGGAEAPGALPSMVTVER